MNWFSFSATTPAHVAVHIDDCRTILQQQHAEGVLYDAIITDPPYNLGLHRIAWDSTDLSFSPELWTLLFGLLKPGGFVAAFAATRLYHRLAAAVEQVGFTLYPFMAWKFDRGLPKPANVSELFDRDNLPEREIIGYRSGSGYTKANVEHGSQNRSTTKFPIYARHVSPEAQEWAGYYYGLNSLLPCMEPILLAQRPIESERAIDNLRKYRTGALNIGALRDRYGVWPSTILEHAKASKQEHQSNHPSVKPAALLEDLCLLLCPTGGNILDPFAGTGTTGVAAQRCGLRCTLIEQNPAMEPVIARRLGLSDAPADTAEYDFADAEH